MTRGGIDLLEITFRIRLPAAYRRLVVPFPVPACAGNTDTELWDDPLELIELNRDLRDGTASGSVWPEHLFALGADEAGSVVVIDLREKDGPVWRAESMHLELIGHVPASPSLKEWGERYVAELRENLEGSGIDPDGTPEDRAEAMARAARAGCREIVLLLLLLLGAILLLAWFVQ